MEYETTEYHIVNYTAYAVVIGVNFGCVLAWFRDGRYFDATVSLIIGLITSAFFWRNLKHGIQE